MTDRISGSAFKQMVLFGAACITLEREAINDLNVFPVPDGDTGTNMSLTIQTAANELKKNQPVTVSDAASITASALLRGARGNSGVILSLLFRGVSKYLKGDEEADGVQLAGALKEGVATAYSAVMKPAEGTVLTVSRLAADRAAEAAEECNSVEYVLQEAIRKGLETLDETIEMNPVLKKGRGGGRRRKGVSGNTGRYAAGPAGEEIPDVSEEKAESKADFSALSEEEITFTFDTVFIVRKWENTSIEPLRAYLSTIGDCLVIGEDDDAFKVHVHTDIPGAAPDRGAKNTAPWSWQKLRICAPSMKPWPPGARLKAPTTWTRWSRSWRAWRSLPTLRRRSSTAFWPCVPGKGWLPPSGIWAWTESCPADRL